MIGSRSSFLQLGAVFSKPGWLPGRLSLEAVTCKYITTVAPPKSTGVRHFSPFSGDSARIRYSRSFRKFPYQDG